MTKRQLDLLRLKKKCLKSCSKSTFGTVESVGLINETLLCFSFGASMYPS